MLTMFLLVTKLVFIEGLQCAYNVLLVTGLVSIEGLQCAYNVPARYQTSVH